MKSKLQLSSMGQITMYFGQGVYLLISQLILILAGRYPRILISQAITVLIIEQLCVLMSKQSYTKVGRSQYWQKS